MNFLESDSIEREVLEEKRSEEKHSKVFFL